AADIAFDRTLLHARRAPHDGMIGTFDRVMLELAGKAVHGAVVLGGDEQSARILVKAVYDPRPCLAAEACKRGAAMRDQRVDERTVGVARGGMHDEPRRLVDDDEILVLVHDHERNGLWL